jgi:competence protein ComEA
VPFSARRSDEDDVIRARLRALLAEGRQARGWVPADDADDALGPGGSAAGSGPRRYDGLDADADPDADAEADVDLDEDAGDEGHATDDGGDRRWPAPSRAGHRERPQASQDAAAGDLPAGLGRHRAPGPATRVDPGRPGAGTLFVAGLLAAVAVVGWTWVDRPAVDRVTAAAPETVAPSTSPGVTPGPEHSPGTAPGGGGTAGDPVVVSVVGQVASPGLVTLPAGSRVADALAAAGGLLPDADPAAVNAAALLADGQQIAVGVPGAGPAVGGVPGGGGAGGPIDLNTATVTDLDALPGIGPILAQRIVDHRTRHGRFTSVEQLDDVDGIGPAIYADLVERVAV